ncbi:MAG: aspartate carbamoyltransferase [Planctomycetes bacterium]|nr:aspartate carbamoyltransferase [Planctomycetota bacterium]
MAVERVHITKEDLEIFKDRRIISMRDFTKTDILRTLEIATRFEGYRGDMLKGRVLGSLFFEPSTRTRLSFDSAMKRLGGTVIGFSDTKGTSSEKGESLVDTIKVVEGYCDAILIRHPLEGAARLAAESTSLPVINGGDGSNQHPTQTFLDIYTINKFKGRLEDLTIAFLGDLQYGRTVHSLVETMMHFNPRVYLVSPPSLSLPGYIVDELKEKNVFFQEAGDILAIDDHIDIIYATRIQRERFPDPMEYEKVQNAYQLDMSTLAQLKSDAAVMHPLPRCNEINVNVDRYPGSLYFEQAHNGVIMRMALLALLMGESDG